MFAYSFTWPLDGLHFLWTVGQTVHYSDLHVFYRELDVVVLMTMQSANSFERPVGEREGILMKASYGKEMFKKPTALSCPFCMGGQGHMAVFKTIF